MKTLGVIIADNYEYTPFCAFADGFDAKHFCEQGFDMLTFNFLSCTVIAIKSGIGKVNAAIAATKLVSEKKADEIYNIGFSGAVHALRRGNIVAGSSFTECDFDLTPLGYKLGEKPEQKYVYDTSASMLAACAKAGLRSVKLGTGDMFLTDDETKKDFYERFGVCAFDMESGAIGAVCDRYNVPFLSIRKISDDSADSAAADYRQMNESEEASLTDALVRVMKVRFNG